MSTVCFVRADRRTQVEVPDDWLETINIWEAPAVDEGGRARDGREVTKEVDGRTVFSWKTAVVKPFPTICPVGYENETVNSLRMWRARSKNSGLALSNGQYQDAMWKQKWLN